MELGLGFDDADFEQKQKTTAGTKTSYNAKICSPLWFEDETEADPNTYIHQQKFSADYHFYKGNYEIAATKYNMLLERIPDSNMPLRQDVQESLCRSYSHLGRHQESTDIAYRMVNMMRCEDEARQRQTLILLAQACREAKDWTGCVGAAEELASGQSHLADFWLELGGAYRHSRAQGGQGDHVRVAQILTCFARARVLLESVQKTALQTTKDRNDAAIRKVNQEMEELGASQELIDKALQVMRTDLEHNSSAGDEDEETNSVREVQHHIPKGMQRPDNRCGNVNVGSTGMLPYFKALCDPDGATPCCYHHVCRNKTIQECACTNCEDMRTPIQAEYATWRTVDPSCQTRSWTVEAICRLLNNATIHFIGDSLMRHFFTAFLLTARGDPHTGAFRPDMKNDLRKMCSGLYMFTEKTCRQWVDMDTTICNGSATVRMKELWTIGQANEIRDAVLSLRNTTRSLAVFGIGFHNGFSVEPVKTRILQSILQMLKPPRHTSPHLLWAGVHQFGMLKSALLTKNSNAARAYNKAIQQFLDQHNVFMFDTFNLTDNVMSFDGTHYGYGLNVMKVNIFLHYIQELAALGKW